MDVDSFTGMFLAYIRAGIVAFFFLTLSGFATMNLTEVMQARIDMAIMSFVMIFYLEWDIRWLSGLIDMLEYSIGEML